MAPSDLEQDYYNSLFRRDFEEAKRLYRLIAVTKIWSNERLIKEGHKCGIYDEGEKWLSSFNSAYPDQTQR